MNEPIFLIKGRRIAASSPGLQEMLRDIYGSAERPRCMCQPGGVDMYIARHSYLVVKRMPGTGTRHHPSCEAYEPDADSSGLGTLMGEAVIEHGPDLVELRVNFPLTSRGGRPIIAGGGDTPADVKIPKHAMSMRALMHWLFERAGFNKWYPAMAGKRSQHVLHRHLMEAAADVQTKGMRLADRLLVPEGFVERDKERQFAERRRKLATLHAAAEPNERRMALVIGEFKSVEDTPSGHKLWIKHMPDIPLFIQTSAWRKIMTQYAGLFRVLELEHTPRPRLVITALVYARHERAFQIDSACFMLTSANWIPLDGVHELELIDSLTRQGRSFIKPLRYDAANVGQFANATLVDTGEQPTPLHVVSAFASERERKTKDRVLAAQPDAWAWDTSQPMPDLPPRVVRHFA